MLHCDVHTRVGVVRERDPLLGGRYIFTAIMVFYPPNINNRLQEEKNTTIDCGSQKALFWAADYVLDPVQKRPGGCLRVDVERKDARAFGRMQFGNSVPRYARGRARGLDQKWRFIRVLNNALPFINGYHRR